MSSLTRFARRWLIVVSCSSSVELQWRSGDAGERVCKPSNRSSEESRNRQLVSPRALRTAALPMSRAETRRASACDASLPPRRPTCSPLRGTVDSRVGTVEMGTYLERRVRRALPLVLLRDAVIDEERGARRRLANDCRRYRNHRGTIDSVIDR